MPAATVCEQSQPLSGLRRAIRSLALQVVPLQPRSLGPENADSGSILTGAVGKPLSNWSCSWCQGLLGKEPCFLASTCRPNVDREGAPCTSAGIKTGVKPSPLRCGARKAFLFAKPLWAPMEIQRSGEQLQGKGFWPLALGLVCCFFLSFAELSPPNPSLSSLYEWAWV